VLFRSVRGNILGACDPETGSVQWNKARVTAYGSIPEHRPRSLGEGVSLWESGSWRGRFPELSGLYNSGERYYQPMGGYFISPDLVYDSRNQSDFSFCGGDPVNYIDPTGLFGKLAGYGMDSAWDARHPMLAGATFLDQWGFRHLGWDRGYLSSNDRLFGAYLQASLSYGQSGGGFDGGQLATGVAMTVGGFIPWVGDAMDVYDVAAPGSTGWDRTFGGASLTLNAMTGGLLPNYAPVKRGLAKIGDAFRSAPSAPHTPHGGSGPPSGGGGVPPNTPPVRPNDSSFYSVGYEANLQRKVHYPGFSDERHFQEANRQLYEAFQADPQLAQQMERIYPGITQGVQPGPRGAFSRSAPTPDVTWHHHPDREGVLQLVPFDQHTATGPIQQSLHPNGRGGMENWGGGRRRR